ncbi:hypothetical protein LTR37_004573 [Vermiconidia calcicola]|uniref:Uncharacterized protein n=1 Tax=Vermiconidia calcicola TaxID=1690605 RepID=A0ACC3NLD2_9PEZI|nr:hypothetical protein LTR37_004573 [Vermiconidia calcicola]
MYPTPTSPTLVVPSRVRTLDPAWADCDAALEGLLDPPIALAEQTTITRPPNENGLTYLADSIKTTSSGLSTQETSTAGKASPGITNDPLGPLRSALDPGPELGTSSTKPSYRAAGESDSHRSIVTVRHTTYHYTDNAPSHVRSRSISELLGRPHFEGEPTGPLGGPPSISSTTYAEDMSEIFLENSKSSYIVGGQTFAPGSPITLGGESSVVTYRMLTSSSQTFIAVGTTTTVPLDDKASSSPISAFIEASRGNFVLHGATLQSGESVTIGSSSSKSTLRMTTGRNPPELVVDESVTIPLEPAATCNNSSLPAKTSLPAIIRASTSRDSVPSPSSLSSNTSTKTSSSGGVDSMPAFCLCVLLLFLTGCILAC